MADLQGRDEKFDPKADEAYTGMSWLVVTFDEIRNCRHQRHFSNYSAQYLHRVLSGSVQRLVLEMNPVSVSFCRSSWLGNGVSFLSFA